MILEVILVSLQCIVHYQSAGSGNPDVACVMNDTDSLTSTLPSVTATDKTSR